MCSEETRTLGDTLVDYHYDYYGSDRLTDFYPLLDRVVAWMDQTYS